MIVVLVTLQKKHNDIPVETVMRRSKDIVERGEAGLLQSETNLVTSRSRRYLQFQEVPKL